MRRLPGFSTSARARRSDRHSFGTSLIIARCQVRIRAFWEPVIIAELDDTAEAWRSALDQLAAQPAPAHLRPYAGLRLGQHLVAERERVEAKEVLATASEDAVALGSTLLTDRIAALAQRAGFVVAPPTEASPVAGLTPRELEVLQLVAAGRSNGEIGTALFISTKTASVHVSNILAKLGVSGRGEAAALAHRVGLTVALNFAVRGLNPAVPSR